MESVSGIIYIQTAEDFPIMFQGPVILLLVFFTLLVFYVHVHLRTCS